ncbi:hypothetical protein [Frigoriglobus tundricola]|uniref:Uncharacterized protein n=1 Tax=Frigoriglobus tundricola TaxID=2774151 RepID=A0A6M5YJI9_9BACT|nr:hypothetical protein [Frigoriglobus tundricola]QJW93132.1 hypothetical protein FTUN_0635 [Frigoriglobus tundricola]
MNVQQSVTSRSTSTANPPPLIGRYEPPDVRKEDRVYCRFRKGWCRVTGWGTGPIRWPRVQQIGVWGQPGLLVNATLERAVRTESALAISHWFGVSQKPVTWWRRAFGVGGHVGTPGSRQLRRRKDAGETPAPAMACAERVTEAPEPSTPVEVGGRPSERQPGAAPELARLGADRDEVIATELGRATAAVTWQRCDRGIPAPRRAVTPGLRWTTAEVALLGVNTDEVIAARIGRTVVAVTSKRIALRIPPFVPGQEPAGTKRIVQQPAQIRQENSDDST